MSSKINGKLAFDVISFIARFGMAWVWIDAGVHKLGKTLDMTQAIKGYDIFTVWTIKRPFTKFALHP